MLPRLETGDCLTQNAWICPEFVSTRRSEISGALIEHVWIVAASVILGVVIALPLAVFARRSQRLTQFILGASTAIYTIPSLALFSLLLPFTGLNASTVITGLALYNLTILVRGTLAGLEAVSPDVKDAANGMGFDAARSLLRVEFPLALPTIFASLRVALVSTIAMTTIGAIVGYGGLGNLINDGLNSFFKAEVLTASVLCVVLAVVADLFVVGATWLSTPWKRGVA